LPLKLVVSHFYQLINIQKVKVRYSFRQRPWDGHARPLL
jgi:hypothetical protein